MIGRKQNDRTTIWGESDDSAAEGQYVLYAEDNPTDAIFFKRLFRKTDSPYKLIHMVDGKLTKEFILNYTEKGMRAPKLIILDIKMPGYNGLELLKFIRTNSSTKRIPVIMMSASSEPVDINYAYDNDASAYLVKPTNYFELQRLIQSIDAFWLKFNRTPE